MCTCCIGCACVCVSAALLCFECKCALASLPWPLSGALGDPAVHTPTHSTRDPAALQCTPPLTRHVTLSPCSAHPHSLDTTALEALMVPPPLSTTPVAPRLSSLRIRSTWEFSSSRPPFFSRPLQARAAEAACYILLVQVRLRSAVLSPVCTYTVRCRGVASSKDPRGCLFQVTLGTPGGRLLR